MAFHYFMLLCVSSFHCIKYTYWKNLIFRIRLSKESLLKSFHTHVKKLSHHQFYGIFERVENNTIKILCWLMCIINPAFLVLWKAFQQQWAAWQPSATSPGKGTKACRMLTENGTPLPEALSSMGAQGLGFRPPAFTFGTLQCKHYHQRYMTHQQQERCDY